MCPGFLKDLKTTSPTLDGAKYQDLISVLKEATMYPQFVYYSGAIFEGLMQSSRCRHAATHISIEAKTLLKETEIVSREVV